MTPEQAIQIRAAYERHVVAPLTPKDTPASFYWNERFGPQPTTIQLMRHQQQPKWPATNATLHP